MDPAERLIVYADESVHLKLGFVVVAFVIATEDLGDRVARALLSVGLKPDVDEFKSGAFMATNPSMAALRDRLYEIVEAHARVAAAFCGTSPRKELGEDCLRALDAVVRRNGLSSVPITVYWDQGIFRSSRRASELAKAFPGLGNVDLRPGQDSRTCRGIQLADLVAHTLAQIIREPLTGSTKHVPIGGPDTGYRDDAEAPLGWALLMGLRYRFLTRPYVNEGQAFDPAAEPVIIGPNEDVVDYAQHPEVIGWGIQVSEDVDDTLRTTVRETLGRIWLGCIH